MNWIKDAWQTLAWMARRGNPFERLADCEARLASLENPPRGVSATTVTYTPTIYNPVPLSEAFKVDSARFHGLTGEYPAP